MNMSNTRPTLKQIAQMAGVTPATVSMVLNKSGRVSEEMKKKVKEIADQLDYRPNVIAQGLVNQHLKLIGMVIPSFHDDFSHDVFLGIENYAKDLGYKVLVGLSNNEEREEERLIEEFIQLNVAGLIILPSPTYWSQHPLYERLAQGKVPFVFYTRYPKDGSYDHVICDDVLGGEMAVQHLLDKGHKRIAFYNSRMLENANDSIDKKQGYVNVLQKAGIPIDSDLIVNRDELSDTESIIDWVERKKVTAIFVSTDYSAIRLMQRLQEAGYRIPEDIAIVGYDDIRMAKMCAPRLTTIQVPKQELGTHAARLIVSSKHSSMLDTKRELQLKPTLIVRGSS